MRAQAGVASGIDFVRENAMDNNSQALDRVILGDNQFFAVNHMSQERAFAQAERFARDEPILSVIRTAYQCGIRSMMLHSHPRAQGLCDALREDPGEWAGFGLYACIPYAYKYVMALNEKGLYPVLMDQLKKGGLGGSLSMLTNGAMGLAAGNYLKLMQVLIDLELQIFAGVPVRAVFLHNVFVDLVLALKVEGLLSFFVDHVRGKYGLRPGFGTLNLPLLAEQLIAEKIEDAVIMTPVNKIGFFMNPSQKACELVLQDRKINVIAMSILASGAVPAEEAFSYAASFPAVKGFLFGASRTETLQKSTAILQRL